MKTEDTCPAVVSEQRLKSCVYTEALCSASIMIVNDTDSLDVLVVTLLLKMKNTLQIKSELQSSIINQNQTEEVKMLHRTSDSQLSRYFRVRRFAHFQKTHYKFITE